MLTASRQCYLGQRDGKSMGSRDTRNHEWATDLWGRKHVTSLETTRWDHGTTGPRDHERKTNSGGRKSLTRSEAIEFLQLFHIGFYRFYIGLYWFFIGFIQVFIGCIQVFIGFTQVLQVLYKFIQGPDREGPDRQETWKQQRNVKGIKNIYRQAVQEIHVSCRLLNMNANNSTKTVKTD